MARVYFDTNVFSNLRANKDAKFQELNNLLKIYQLKLSFYFSIAHIRDKRKDSSDFKFRDFEFMEGFVGDNYLAYDPIKKRPSFYLATPLMAFNDHHPESEFSLTKNFFEPSEDDEESAKDLKSTIKTLFSSIPLQLPERSYDTLTDNQKQLMSELIPAEKNDLNFFDMIQSVSGFIRKINTDTLMYKELRNMIYTGINNGGLNLNPDTDFNEALKHTAVQKSFTDFVKDNMHTQDKSKIPFYDYYNVAYAMLDAFGISKDKLTAKNELSNMRNDGMHSYFASYCDYFVTDDKTTILKSNAMYGLSEVKTKVVTVDEFKTLLPNLLADFDEDWDWFTKKIINDLTRAGRQFADVIGDKTVYRLDSNHRYLDFFDAVLEVKGSNSYEVILFKGESNLLSEPSFSEQAQIINRALVIFGNDIEGIEGFDYKEIENGNTDTAFRKWIVGDFIYELKVSELINKYALVITWPEIIPKSIPWYKRLLKLLIKHKVE
ncbi:MAG: hypothetical protein ABIN91_02595 [Mucilaginibacter sp.]|uniref:hypothetical protein n=1 Tax=Mucilaginibacter sp. TaxID=1882438 RepID=UPI003266DF74